MWVFPDISIWISEIHKLPLAMWWASSNWGPEWNKRWRKEEFTPFFYCLSAWATASHFIFSNPQTGIYSNSPPGAQAFGLRLNYTTLFPGSPACRWQILELLRLHNQVSQFFIIKLPILILWRIVTNISPQQGYLVGVLYMKAYVFWEIHLAFLAETKYFSSDFPFGQNFLLNFNPFYMYIIRWSLLYYDFPSFYSCPIA